MRYVIYVGKIMGKGDAEHIYMNSEKEAWTEAKKIAMDMTEKANAETDAGGRSFSDICVGNNWIEVIPHGNAKDAVLLTVQKSV